VCEVDKSPRFGRLSGNQRLARHFDTRGGEGRNRIELHARSELGRQQCREQHAARRILHARSEAHRPSELIRQLG
jgi:hypothetical protein